MVVLIVYLYFPAHGRSLGPSPRSRPSIWVCQPWLPIFIYRSWSLICIYRSWPPICVYRPWPPICIYQPWSSSLYLPSLGQICIYQSWPPMCVYLPQCVFTPMCVYYFSALVPKLCLPTLALAMPRDLYLPVQVKMLLLPQLLQSNLYKTTTLGTTQKWSSWAGGRLIKHLHKTTTKQMWSLLAGF